MEYKFTYNTVSETELPFEPASQSPMTMNLKGKLSKLYKPNGPREVARRLRQIKEGKLKNENGLIERDGNVS